MIASRFENDYLHHWIESVTFFSPLFLFFFVWNFLCWDIFWITTVEAQILAQTLFFFSWCVCWNFLWLLSRPESSFHFRYFSAVFPIVVVILNFPKIVQCKRGCLHKNQSINQFNNKTCFAALWHRQGKNTVRFFLPSFLYTHKTKEKPNLLVN